MNTNINTHPDKHDYISEDGRRAAWAAVDECTARAREFGARAKSDSNAAALRESYYRKAQMIVDRLEANRPR